jgi:two-component system, NtrC family, response regulator AtoC
MHKPLEGRGAWTTDRDRPGARKISDVHPVSTEPAVLLIASPGELSTGLAAALTKRGYPPAIAGSLELGLVWLASGAPRLVVLALPLAEATGRDAIARMKAADGGVQFIVVGVDGELTGAGEAFDLGAQEHLVDPLADTSEFLATIGVVLGSRRGDRHLQYLRAKEAPATGWQGVIGESPALQRVLGILRQVCSRTSQGATPTILLNGETGTGKGFVARCVHYNGVRRNRPFVEVNCATLPPSLMESELFGHERGSFTDAKAARAGLFETADGGTLFLDEIGAVPVDLQAKLLTAIEEKRVRRIGAQKGARVDVQIIAATHEDLRRRSSEGTFREDLFHRLNVVAVTMPALRDRGADVVMIGEAFLRSLCLEYGMPPRQLADDAKRWLESYAWPGNVRELRNQIERIVLLENDNVVRAEHFGGGTDGAVRVTVTQGSGPMRLRVSLPPNGVPLGALEREVIREALARCEGNVSQTARYLSISRQTLIYRMKKYRLGE